MKIKSSPRPAFADETSGDIERPEGGELIVAQQNAWGEFDPRILPMVRSNGVGMEKRLCGRKILPVPGAE